MLRVTALAAPIIALLTLAASAQALPSTRYVTKTGDDAGGGNTCTTQSSPCKTIGEAVGFAQAGDTILIGAGTFPEAITVSKANLTFRGTTGTFVDADALPQPAFTTANNAITLDGLKIRGGILGDGHGGEVLPAISGGGTGHPAVTITNSTIIQAAPSGPDAWDHAIDYASGSGKTAQLTIDHSSVTGYGAGVTVGSGTGGSQTITRSTITASTVQPPQAIGVTIGAVFAQVPLTITDSHITGFDAVAIENAPTSITRTRIDAVDQGIGFLDANGGAQVTLRDSIVEPVTGTELSQAVLFGTGMAETTTGTLNLIGDTIRAQAVTFPIALELSNAPGGMAVHVHNTILQATASNGGVQHDIDGTASAFAWDIGTSAFTDTRGVGVPAPGSGTNIDAVPSGTNLYDRGDATYVQAGETDEAGLPRAVDFNCDGIAQPDIGADEAPAPVCTPPQHGGGGGGGNQNPPPPPSRDTTKPTLTKLSFADASFAVAAARRRHHVTIHHGTKLRFTLSETASVKVAVALRTTRKHHTVYVSEGSATYARQGKGAHSVAFKAKIGTHALAAGTYRATITATDPAGNHSTAHHLTFTIVTG